MKIKPLLSLGLSLAIGLTLWSCVSVPITPPTGPGGVILSVDPTGVTFTQQGYLLWQNEGVPASYFTSTPEGPHLTNLMWQQGNAIRIHRINPSIAVPESTMLPTKKS